MHLFRPPGCVLPADHLLRPVPRPDGRVRRVPAVHSRRARRSRQERGLYRRQGVQQALATPVPPARSGTQAQAADPARAVATRHCGGAAGTVPPRALPLRWLPGHQLDDEAGGRLHQALRVPALLLQQRERRHPGPLLLGIESGAAPVEGRHAAVGIVMLA